MATLAEVLPPPKLVMRRSDPSRFDRYNRSCSCERPAAALASYLRKAPLAAAWGRLIEPAEVAGLIRYLCSDAAAMITGATITIDGGKSLDGPA